MSDSVSANWVDRLREEFDLSFQRAHQSNSQHSIEALSLSVGQDLQPYLLRVDALSLLQRMPAVRPLPGAADSVLGLSLLRGRVVTVFFLARLLGRPASDSPAWIVGVGAELDYALAFAELTALRRIDADAIRPAGSQSSPHIRQALIEHEHSIPLIDLESISNHLGQASPAHPLRERQP